MVDIRTKCQDVSRWDVILEHRWDGSIVPVFSQFPNGPWVKHNDYNSVIDALLAKIDALKKVNEFFYKVLLEIDVKVKDEGLKKEEKP